MAVMNTEIQGEMVHVAVQGLAVGGAAVGRVVGPEGSPRIGMTAFVPFAAPGETISARVTKPFPRYLDAELVEVLTPTDDRTTPPCPYFGACGGCDIQHLTYDAQLRAKRGMVQGAFRAAGLADLSENIGDVVPGPPLAYRRRITLHIDGLGQIGYFRRRSHTVLPVTNCPIATPAVDAFLGRGITFAGAVGPEFSAELHVEAGENGLFAVVKSAGHLSAKEANRLIEKLRPHTQGAMVEADGRTIAQFGSVGMLRKLAGVADEEAEGEAAPGAFSQVNATVNEQLVAQVVATATSINAKTVYDFYSGSGNFSLPLAMQGMTVTAVETVATLVATGRAEAARCNVSERLTFHRGDVAHYLQKTLAPADLIIADPPRAGLGKIAPLLTFAPHLLLISCHLPSVTRDIKALQSVGWQVQSVTPLDMFPQTAYIELITYLTK